MSVILDSEHLSYTLSAGFYPAIDISTSLNPQGNVRYVHHVHSTTITGGTTIENENYAASSVTTMPEYQNTSGGCYTKAVTENHYHQAFWRVVDDDESHNGQYWGPCPACGKPLYKHHIDPEDHRQAVSCGGYAITRYYANCGYQNGELVSATITY